MELYGQEPEAELLATFLPRLPSQCVVDVGAERGSFVAAMLRAGADEVHAVEPELANVAHLQERFAAEPRVTVHPFAAGNEDGEATLHLASDREGGRLSFGHTFLERSATDEIAWTETLVVPVRSLDSLARSGTIPRRVGVLKIDTEGNDLAVLQGLGVLDPDVVMVEHWLELPRSLGKCPWKAEHVTSLLAARSFLSFAFLRHHNELVTLRWDDPQVEAGEMGNLIFLHDRVAALLMPEVLACASRLADSAVERVDDYARVAEARQGVIEEMQREAELHTAASEETAPAVSELRGVVTARDETIALLLHEIEVQTAAATDRLDALNRLSAERDSTVEQLQGELDLQRNAATDRLTALEELGNNAKRNAEGLERERDVQTQAAAERQVAIDRINREHTEVVTQFEAELEELRRTASERLVLIDDLAAERELLEKIAAERLSSIERLSQELEVQAVAAEQRLAALEGLERVRGSQGGERGGWR